MGKKSLGWAGWTQKSAAAATLALLCACSTPAFIDEGKDPGVSSIWPNQVTFKKEVDVVHADCVTVRHLSGDWNEKVTDAFRRYMSVLAKSQEGCALVLEGGVIENRSTNIAVASRVAVGAKVELTLDNKVVWHAEHTASTWGGGLPIDPISAITTILSAFDNGREEQIDRVVNDAVRRLVSTMPQIISDQESEVAILQPGPVAPIAAPAPLLLKASFTPKIQNAVETTTAADRAFNLGVSAFDAGDRPQAVRMFRQASLSYLNDGRIDDAEHAAAVIQQIARDAN